MWEGENARVAFTIDVDAVYSNFYNISGNVYITNTGGFPACVTGVKDTVRYKTSSSGWLSAVTSVTTEVPGVIPVGGPYAYPYSGTFYLPLPLDSVTAMSNKIEITISNCSQPETPTFCCVQDFTKPSYAAPGTMVLEDVEKIVPASGLSCVTDSVTINGAPASSSGPWQLDMSGAPFKVVVTRTLTGEEAGEYALCNTANAGEACSQADVYILVREKPGKKISGHKYEDLDCDGALDPGEPGVAGWAITLNGFTTVLTDANGYYEFTCLPCGIYLVSEEHRAGWHNTTPDLASVDLMCSNTGTADFLNYREGNISGHKYEDLDGDGALDPGEPGVPGWEVTLTTPCGLSVTTLTDNNGYYRFCNLACGDYQVTEGKRNGWYPTSDSEAGVHLDSGSSAVIDFLNSRKGKITGHKYEDLDGDGTLDPGEPGVPGWEIWLNGEGPYLTDTNGYFEFTCLRCGDYLLREGSVEGWYPTGATEVNIHLESNGSFVADFLNSRMGRISGWKYEDPDRDGVHDDGEPPMPGVTIELRDKDGAFIDSTVTVAGGYFEFAGLAAGEYIVAELVPDGYAPTVPPETAVNLASGGSVEVMFLNAETHCSISGTKWDDLDGDGIAGASESGLEGITIQLWSGDTLVETTITGIDGKYLIGGIEPGDYLVREVVPGGMYATSPTDITVVLEPGEDVTGVDFLNARHGSISGTKWDDPDADGVHQATEAGVPGVTITLSRNGATLATATTAAGGTYNFGGLAAGKYTVTETLPSGFANTTPVSVFVTVITGQDVIGVDFLNVAVAGEVITPAATPTTTTGTETMPYTGFDLIPWLLTAGLLALAGLLILTLGVALNGH